MLNTIIDLLEGAKYLWEGSDDNYQFAIYNPNCDTVEVNIANNKLVIPCSIYNAAVIFDNVNDIVYLYRLAEEASGGCGQKIGLP